MNASQVSQPPPIDPKRLSFPEDASLFTRLHVAVSILRVIKGNEGNPDYGQTLNKALDINVYTSLVPQIQRSEEGRRLLSERPSLESKNLDLEALARLPEGTLGHELARYFQNNKISPFETTLEIKTDIDFISKRYRETHDLLHVVTGYGTDEVGEVELQAYVLGNLGIRTAALIVLYGMIQHLKVPQPGVERSEYLRRLWAAYRRGSASPLFLDFWFEHHWETPVATLRTRLCAPAEGMN
ncbi:Coq4 family protein [Polyangium aurulentum]|uniref:Coq4 family protein n=1 Tax=Polyangium aurulentum TaxID=2567896 RepID=UPI0010AE4F57|nr:Coq4 family protein [Polyangium aurulentum]UQA58535.1 ubiquinone biosynthesis protein COQ4 [Polyangium aurulentum]